MSESKSDQATESANAIIVALAQQHGVTYRETESDRLANAFARL
ncbi:hypothetical protein [Bradyrhizobium yuanmingense]|nr:hypothetical protein [Bradyrhizobium yuanmingense]MDF0522191.1 hypothetical protein [Bradyrhizobium yuanmingense]